MSGVFLDENAYLIHLVKCAIHNEQPREIPDPLWFETVYQYGVWHQVANIAFYSVKKLEKRPSAELYREWESCCNKAVIRDFTQSYARDELVSGFQEANIRYLEVQGTEIKKLYPQPEYRTMSDLDFIIDLENLSKAADVLQNLGYQCKDVKGVEVDGFRSPNINVEVHTAYFPETSHYHSIMRPPFASVEETGQYDINEFYIYNMLHIAKHYFGGGCGIRRVLDVYYLNLNYGKIIDKQYVNSVLEAANVRDFAAQLSSLANNWFGNRNGDIERNDMASYIFESGVHGTNHNRWNNSLKTMRDKGVRFFKLKYVFSRLFAGKETMYTLYPFLKRWKVLYPFCWLHRAIRAVCSKRKKRIFREVKTVISVDLDHTANGQ